MNNQERLIETLIYAIHVADAKSRLAIDMLVTLLKILTPKDEKAFASVEELWKETYHKAHEEKDIAMQIALYDAPETRHKDWIAEFRKRLQREMSPDRWDILLLSDEFKKYIHRELQEKRIPRPMR